MLVIAASTFSLDTLLNNTITALLLAIIAIGGVDIINIYMALLVYKLNIINIAILIRHIGHYAASSHDIAGWPHYCRHCRHYDIVIRIRRFVTPYAPIPRQYHYHIRHYARVSINNMVINNNRNITVITINIRHLRHLAQRRHHCRH